MIDHTVNDDFNLKVVRDKAYWTSEISHDTIDANKLKQMLAYVIDNTYFSIGDKLFKQIIGIPMGTKCAPPVANLMLHNMEFKYMMYQWKMKNFPLVKKLSNTFRYIDDITTINANGLLTTEQYNIYPNSLTLKKVNRTNKTADVLDLTIKIDNHKFTTATYDKRRDYQFEIVNFPHTYSNISVKMCYNVYCEQVRRHSDLNTNVSDFVNNIIILNSKISQRGYNAYKLQFHFTRTIKKHKLHLKYNLRVQELVNKMF